ncbi:spore coat U domain-containing protein [Methylococcus sp. Mc7]|uniref:Csu type fimbrial protein n=1 Tax=Methylococcus sp. Mc7 TaxID=2860258 RepID=UPI001C530582|nr:spore coat U domain-containing protein [Methylococcus sp. Mc7]QXP85002.1 spore coat U domain-containing protein [Methylococcus sp. Mc7]
MNTLVSKHTTLRRAAGLAAAIVFVAGAGTTEAASTTATFAVTAAVANNCRLRNVTAVAFGAYDPTGGTATTAAGSFDVRCTKSSTAYGIYLSGGSGSGASCTGTPVRAMTAGTDSLPYGLYQNAGYTTVWGCDATNQYNYTSTSSGAWTTVPIYGQIPADQDVPAGSYSDTITVTVNF